MSESDMNIKLWNKIDAFIRNHEISEAIEYLGGLLSEYQIGHFENLSVQHFVNDEEKIGLKINKFIRDEEDIRSSRFYDVKAVYLEMNGFDINTGQWYFDFFAYDKKIDEEQLPNWKSGHYPKTILTGLKETQKDFEWLSFKGGHQEKYASEVAEIARLLVMSKFVMLISSAVETKKIKKQIPIWATAHGFDIIGKFHS